ncbi:TetR/AcrR family transcriptional regulator [Leisingera sp. SS27]|uniref:TetR/AcrR family transcriptional regulator n=1 Tax=Leisingera sp. SS27 TaxID=2979462 RepID=UPI00232BD20A|nr:TetR/AcrR family transcriptional regulator [Leisingera sp. SS27]MDC0660552.1 TetR/AcrR family transcriptional regulator [Leisingera sp. SS27]
MPWEKSFDIDDATDRAMRVFWAKGYEATSLSDLVEGMGINKGSLYNAFGSKRALFDRAILKYDRENRQAALEDIIKIDDPTQAVRTLFDGLIAESIADMDRKGCLLVNTALDLPNHEGDIKEVVTSAFGDFEKFFAKLVRRGQELGQVSKDINPEAKAKALLTLVVGLRVLARGAFEPSDLYAIRDEALSVFGKS